MFWGEWIRRQVLAVKHIQVKFAASVAVDRLLKSDTVQELVTKQIALPVLPAALPFAVF